MDPDSKRAPSSAAGARLRVTVSDGRGRRVPGTGLERWLARVAPPRARGEVAIALVTDARMTALNQTYRRKAVPTDVLSFAAAPGPLIPGRRRAPEPLGDIVIATGMARRQARAAGHAYLTELRVLALHGLLHLLGYDHDDPADPGRMARSERRLRRAAGLGEGLIERGRRGR